MTVIAAAPPATGHRFALGRLTVAELKLLARERVRLIVGVGIPVILVIIFGSIPFYNHPAKVFGGLTLL
ncbi:MAG TPA: hypothetical protein VEC76_08645, partial [Streptosporangiaceae bacterium]|nr:hypothetical protein [Streptosporangiaceae bacterium]